VKEELGNRIGSKRDCQRPHPRVFQAGAPGQRVEHRNWAASESVEHRDPDGELGCSDCRPKAAMWRETGIVVSVGLSDQSPVCQAAELVVVNVLVTPDRLS